MNAILLCIAILFLLGLFFLTAVSSALRGIHIHSRKQLREIGKNFFYRKFHLFFFPEKEYEGLLLASIFAQNLVRFISITAFITFLFFELNFLPSSAFDLIRTHSTWSWIALFGWMFVYIIISFFIGDCFPRILGARFPDKTLQFCTPVASLFLFLAFPINFLLLKISHAFSDSFYFDLSYEPIAEAHREIIELIQKTDVDGDALDVHDKKLIESVMKFKERIAREVMVPRVDVFSLSEETSIKDAAELLVREGYSRIPVYHNTVDNIVGVLMYKDVLNKYVEYEQKGNALKILEVPIASLQKSVLHIPETKRLSSLLQEFRKKQVHLAIVVDEYGGTEGIVTIEDILEEIVGDISDEYDQEDELYYVQPDGTWIVDARMNNIDAESELGIDIPEEGDYDTIGGYIFHKAGTIPPAGFIIHHDDFELEVLSSNDRFIEKVRIKPIANTIDENGESEK
jgi:putative hemolysin